MFLRATLSQVAKEFRALCYWGGLATLVVSMITIFAIADSLFKEVTNEALFGLVMSLVGLMVGNFLWMLGGQRSVFQPEEE